MKNPMKKDPSSLEVAMEETISEFRRESASSKDARKAAETLKILAETKQISEKKPARVPTELKIALLGSATTIVGYLLITKAEETIPVVSKAASIIPKFRW